MFRFHSPGTLFSNPKLPMRFPGFTVLVLACASLLFGRSST